MKSLTRTMLTPARCVRRVFRGAPVIFALSLATPLAAHDAGFGAPSNAILCAPELQVIYRLVLPEVVQRVATSSAALTPRDRAALSGFADWSFLSCEQSGFAPTPAARVEPMVVAGSTLDRPAPARASPEVATLHSMAAATSAVPSPSATPHVADTMIEHLATAFLVVILVIPLGCTTATKIIEPLSRAPPPLHPAGGGRDRAGRRGGPGNAERDRG